MSNQLIDKALKYLGEQVPVIGAFYTGEWSASSSSASGTVLMSSPVALPVGTYIVVVNTPMLSGSLTCYLRTTAQAQIIGNSTRYHVVGSGTTIVDAIQITTAATLQLVSAQSSSVTFSNLDRGYMRAVRIK